ncbi:MAG: biotin/lipoyl-containing protein, partial [Chthoniobacteraceae bacterium]
LDKSQSKTAKVRAKAAANDPLQVGAPIPGMVTSLSATVGGKVAKGDKLAVLEAMKMQTTIYAPTDGVIAEVLATAGDSVEAGDLLVKLRA